MLVQPRSGADRLSWRSQHNAHLSKRKLVHASALVSLTLPQDKHDFMFMQSFTSKQLALLYKHREFRIPHNEQRDSEALVFGTTIGAVSGSVTLWDARPSCDYPDVGARRKIPMAGGNDGDLASKDVRFKVRGNCLSHHYEEAAKIEL